jgi:dihydroflavonol-4-reductase
LTVLVTGASGHIGAHLVRGLLEQGRAVRAFVRPTSNLKGLEGLDVEIVWGNVLDRSTLDKALKGCSSVYHLAAVVADSALDPSIILKTAINGTVNVLQAVANISGIARVVYTSLAATVGLSSSPDELRNESHCNTEDTTPYSIAKTQAAQLARKLAARYSIPLVIVNPCQVLGPLDYRPTPITQTIVRFLCRRQEALGPGLDQHDQLPA